MFYSTASLSVGLKVRCRSSSSETVDYIVEYELSSATYPIGISFFLYEILYVIVNAENINIRVISDPIKFLYSLN